MKKKQSPKKAMNNILNTESALGDESIAIPRAVEDEVRIENLLRERVNKLHRKKTDAVQLSCETYDKIKSADHREKSNVLKEAAKGYQERGEERKFSTIAHLYEDVENISKLANTLERYRPPERDFAEPFSSPSSAVSMSEENEEEMQRVLKEFKRLKKIVKQLTDGYNPPSEVLQDMTIPPEDFRDIGLAVQDYSHY